MGIKMEISTAKLQKEIDFLRQSADEIAELPCLDYPQYTDEEVAAIIAKEQDKVEKNYRALLFEKSY